jgi:hypothetical protein
MSFVVAATVALGAVLAGCGSETGSSPDSATDNVTTSASPTAAAEPAEGRLLTPAQAKAALPAVSELTGSGWTASATPPDDEPDPKVTPASCDPLMNQISTDYAGYKPKLAAKESITFTNETSGHTEVLFEVASWTNAADSALPLAAAELADRCKTFTGTDADISIEFTAEPLTPLKIGEKQAAVRLTAAAQGTKIHLTVFEAKVGHNLISVVQTSTNPTDQSEYKPLIDGILSDLGAAR